MNILATIFDPSTFKVYTVREQFMERCSTEFTSHLELEEQDMSESGQPEPRRVGDAKISFSLVLKDTNYWEFEVKDTALLTYDVFKPETLETLQVLMHRTWQAIVKTIQISLYELSNMYPGAVMFMDEAKRVRIDANQLRKRSG